MREATDFDNLFRSYYEPLFRFANQYIRNEDDCHDIVSEAFETVWVRFDHIRKDAVKSFLYTHVRNRCIDYLRHQGRHQKYVDFVNHHSEQFIEKQEFEEQQERQQIIADILMSLDDKTRQILTACYIDGKKYHEVAEAFGVSLSTVKKRMLLALNLIREKRKKR